MKSVAKNRKALHDYEITDKLEAGILLSGQEVKSCRGGNVHLAGSYVSLASGRPVLKQATIAPYRYASDTADYNPEQDRQLLLTKKEIAKLQTLLEEKGVSAVPLEVIAGKYIKVVIGVGRGRKKYDKRENKKRQDIERRLRTGQEY